MSTSNENKESITDLIRQARRAQEIISLVDFQKIAAHDAEEVDKLAGVTEALEKLNNGEVVDRIDGVDEVRNTDPRQAWIAELLEMLDVVGYSDRVGRVFALTAGEDKGHWKPLAMVPHREGVPLHDLCLAPNFSPAEGAHGLFISATGVFSAHVAQPFNRHERKVLRSQRYDTNAELLATIVRYLNPPDA
ncbi:MAG: hypothetical protein FJ194_09880 [Gammaproteobacteria bacterium]|nr:hypothetical protein [Gammaproteobacteria bacterium]